MPVEVLHLRRALLPGGWSENVRLELGAGGMIRSVTTDQPAAGEAVDGAVVPGLPNLHSHGFQALMAGLTGRRSPGGDSFWTWRQAMYRTASQLDPDMLDACMGGVYLEMLRAGYTTCAEFHYLHHAVDGRPYSDPAEMSRRVIGAARRSGIGLTLLPVYYHRAGFDGAALSGAQRRFGHQPDTYLDLVRACRALVAAEPNMALGIAPHSLRAVPVDHFREILADLEPGSPVHMHVAEQSREVEECVAHLGARPVEWLLANGEIGPQWCLVHATHMTAGETRQAAASGAVAGLCPTTEADLGDGIFPAADWNAAGGEWGIGSDSNLRLAPSEELRLLEFTQRLASGRRNVLADEQLSCGRFLYEHAAAGGGLAVGQPLGRIDAGFRADLVELDTDQPGLAGLEGDQLLDSYVFSGDAEWIRSVWVAGSCLVHRGQHALQEKLEAGLARALRFIRGTAGRSA